MAVENGGIKLKSRNLNACVLALTLCNAAEDPYLDAVATRPSFILIISDDAGYVDYGFMGSKEIRTPSLDKLAKQGIRFLHAYAGPTCSPSRCGLLSGHYSQRHGFGRNCGARFDEPNDGFPKDVKTLPALLKAHGYVTGMAGKWHVGYKNPEHVNPPEADNAPWNRGFDYVTIHDSGMSHFYNFSEVGAEWNLWRGIDNRYQQKMESDKEPHFIEQMDPDTYMTDYLTDETCAFIRRNKSEPWFFYLSYNAPHTPMVPKKGKMEKL